MDAGETFALCISRVRDPALRLTLSRARPAIEAEAATYERRATRSELHRVLQTTSIGGVPIEEMVRTYDSRMAKKGQPGRKVYDEIKMLPENDTCPFCGHRSVSTLDHILPKGRYAPFTVTPVNLVASCSDCNKAKGDRGPTQPVDTILHPYFDDVTDRQWLFASVVPRVPAAVHFRVQQVQQWSNVLNARVVNQFALL